MTYRLCTKFETLYTHEIENKIEINNDLDQVKRTFGIYMENPEVVFCSIERIPSANYSKPGKLIAVFNPR